jgi:hypothetical protein
MSLPNEVNLQLLASSKAYNIDQSLRFRASATAYLNRTFGTPTNNRVWTWSAWVKRGSLSLADANHLFLGSPTDVGGNPTSYTRLIFETDNTLRLQSNASASEAFTSSAVFRDPAAWYHIVLYMDAVNTTVRCYVNGTEIAYASRSNPTNQNTAINGSGNHHRMGLFRSAETRPFDGYMAEVNFVDGQALTPSSFGQADSQTGVWQPKKYGGSYGTNGFYLPFSNTSSTSTLGNDFSGNSNTWTVNNFSLTAGSTYDFMRDSPTLTSDTTANYPVWNSLFRLPTNNPPNTATFSAANLQLASSVGEGSGNSSAVGTMQIPSTGKWYWEVTITDRATLAASRSQIGIIKEAGLFASSLDVAYTETPNACYVYCGNGQKAVSYGSFGTYGAAWTNGDVIGVACDWSAGTLTFYLNGSSQGTAFSGLSGSDKYFPIAGYFGTFNINFGQRPFAYTPPTGFNRLNAFNLPTPTIGATSATQANKYFDVLTWSGTGGGSGATRSLTGLNFQPDFTWQKNRTSTQDYHLFDSVRGAGLNKTLGSNSTGAEGAFGDTSFGYLSSFDSNGVTTTNGSSTWDNWNKSGDTFVAWNWNAGGSTVTNTSGSISSQVRANPSAGFSIVTYTGNGSGGATIGHGLGVAPKMYIVKRRDSGVGATNWYVYNVNLNNGVNPAQYFLLLQTSSGQGGQSNIWNDTAPTSSVFSVGTSSETNGSGAPFVAYCWSEIAGFSKFGTYVGNGSSDGTFVFTGFRPRYFLTKPSSTSGEWTVWDSSRDAFNVADRRLIPSDSILEYNNGNGLIDFLSNGLKCRVNHPSNNESGTTYIYMAFAENPFKYALAR